MKPHLAERRLQHRGAPREVQLTSPLFPLDSILVRNARGLCGVIGCRRTFAMLCLLQVIEGQEIRYGACVPCIVRLRLTEMPEDEDCA